MKRSAQRKRKREQDKLQQEILLKRRELQEEENDLKKKRKLQQREAQQRRRATLKMINDRINEFKHEVNENVQENFSLIEEKFMEIIESKVKEMSKSLPAARKKKSRMVKKKIIADPVVVPSVGPPSVPHVSTTKQPIPAVCDRRLCRMFQRPINPSLRWCHLWGRRLCHMFQGCHLWGRLRPIRLYNSLFCTPMHHPEVKLSGWFDAQARRFLLRVCIHIRPMYHKIVLFDANFGLRMKTVASLFYPMMTNCYGTCMRANLSAEPLLIEGLLIAL